MKVASLILAAGRGSRMTGYGGCKTLLPLEPFSESLYRGNRPFIIEILFNLPSGPKGVVVNYEAEKVKATVVEQFPKDDPITFIFQPVLNGTGGALLAARTFIEDVSEDFLIVTMGDVPLVKSKTYENMVENLRVRKNIKALVLAFKPKDKKQYGCLITSEGKLREIVEWKYWREFDEKRRGQLSLCNAGIYIFRSETVVRYLDKLSERPHKVEKVYDGKSLSFEEFFITDIIEWIVDDGYEVGYIEAPEWEVLGVDRPEDLVLVQALFRRERSL